MNNPHLKRRIEGLLGMLKAVHTGSDSASNETKGAEREAFVDGLLRAALPMQTRFSSGEITDNYNNISGQLDLVVEYPILPSVHLVPGVNARMFLAESVAAVIEIKSDLSTQWNQVIATARKLANIKRNFGSTESPRNRHPTERIPLIAVGYKGWLKETTMQKLDAASNVDAVLDLNEEFFYANIPFYSHEGCQRSLNVLKYMVDGVDSLWGLICVLNEQINDLARTEALASNYTFHNLA